MIDKNIYLDRDIDSAVRVIGKTDVHGLRTPKINYQFKLVDEIMVIVASNEKGKMRITPDTIDMVKKEISIQGKTYKYMEE